MPPLTAPERAVLERLRSFGTCPSPAEWAAWLRDQEAERTPPRPDADPFPLRHLEADPFLTWR
ncbi:hypothetical protein [Rubellimicrobium sp. CFH 75288]|uniref:hypothetical protein n=1 Tax=Rubellimicrobium sp. CFH 75288 TaxID=2697034 RepID=UPI001412E83C|nr:hypothetical protein [Rubellimicrobium sp. CFH 75288]NAZ37129.1 hypothetical protein [Rubellimicrobium sp. CFH 75288]